jgi:hypothetical protein
VGKPWLDMPMFTIVTTTACFSSSSAKIIILCRFTLFYHLHLADVYSKLKFSRIPLSGILIKEADSNAFKLQVLTCTEHSMTHIGSESSVTCAYGTSLLSLSLYEQNKRRRNARFFELKDFK